MSKSSYNSIYKTALTHKSYDEKHNNERLEFLGDAILSSVISDFLFLEKKNHVEGILSQKRSIIVGRKHLNLVGEKIIPSDLSLIHI